MIPIRRILRSDMPDSLAVSMFCVCLMVFGVLDSPWKVIYCKVGLAAFAVMWAMTIRWRNLGFKDAACVAFFWPVMLLTLWWFWKAQEKVRSDSILNDVMRS